MTLLYIICKIITFPGTYFRGFLEHITARSCKCIIESDGYIRFDELSGHVEHSVITKKFPAAVFALLPGTINFILGVILSATGLIPLVVLNPGLSNPAMLVFYIASGYIGLSLLCSLFPLVDDALNCKERIYGENGANIFVKIILFVPVMLCVIGSYLEKYCVNFLLAVLAASALFILI